MCVSEGSAAGDALNTGSDTHSTDFLRVKYSSVCIEISENVLVECAWQKDQHHDCGDISLMECCYR
jgi:hypothetical protein